MYVKLIDQAFVVKVSHYNFLFPFFLVFKIVSIKQQRKISSFTFIISNLNTPFFNYDNIPLYYNFTHHVHGQTLANMVLTFLYFQVSVVCIYRIYFHLKLHQNLASDALINIV